MSEDAELAAPEEADREIVHWMRPRPLTVGAGGISVTAVGAFTLGALATVAVVWLRGGFDRER